jgi:hypothetical protein
MSDKLMTDEFRTYGLFVTHHSATHHSSLATRSQPTYHSPPPGATGFDRTAAVAVACRGRPLGLVKKVGKPLTADNNVAGRIGFGNEAAPMALAA